MAAYPDSIPSSFRSDHAFVSRRFDVIDHGLNTLYTINVSTWNLLNKCFSCCAKGVAENSYNGVQPKKGQIVYTVCGENIVYKYVDEFSIQKERTMPRGVPHVFNGRRTALDYECLILDELRKVEQNFIPKWVKNNPFDANESESNYIKRKREQINWIMVAIEQGDDIINLQEIDFLKSKDNVIKQLQKQFFDQLAQKGYECIVSQDSHRGVFPQSLAVIYNTKKLQFRKERAVFHYTADKGSHRFCGLEITFKQKDPSKHLAKIVNTNLHLQYGHDYKDEIETYQKQFENQPNTMHIMAGDSNNLQTENLRTALGDWNVCTNIGLDEKQELTVYHENTKRVKAYDVAFVVAPQGFKVQTSINRDRSKQFIHDKSGTIQEVISTDKHISFTRMGERWRRGVDILQEKAEELWRKTPALSTEELLRDPEVQEIIKEKGLVNRDSIEMVLNSARENLRAAHLSSASSSSEPSLRGQVWFVRALIPSAVLNAHIYKELLTSPSGTYEGFELMDCHGNTVQSRKASVCSTVFGYPGNTEQALVDQERRNPEEWRFKDTAAPQLGEGLAIIAADLTTVKGVSERGHAFPLPTTFRWGFDLDSAGQARRQYLATVQIQRLHQLLHEGFNVVFFVKPHARPSVFSEDQFVVQKDGISYDLAFWGGVQKEIENGTAGLAAIYADGVKSAATVSELCGPESNQNQIDCSKLWDYLCQREKTIYIFSFFSSVHTKKDSAAKLIQAIIYYNNHGSMDQFPGERLTEAEFDALSDRELMQAVHEVKIQAGQHYPAILESIKPISQMKQFPGESKSL